MRASLPPITIPIPPLPLPLPVPLPVVPVLPFPVMVVVVMVVVVAQPATHIFSIRETTRTRPPSSRPAPPATPSRSQQRR